MASESVSSLMPSLREQVRAYEKSIIIAHLEANKWDKRATAKTLQISYRSILEKMQRLGINWK